MICEREGGVEDDSRVLSACGRWGEHVGRLNGWGMKTRDAVCSMEKWRVGFCPVLEVYSGGHPHEDDLWTLEIPAWSSGSLELQG